MHTLEFRFIHENICLWWPRWYNIGTINFSELDLKTGGLKVYIYELKTLRDN